MTPGNFSGPAGSHPYMLVLPTGQILLTNDESNQLDIYTPDGSPAASWRPTITAIHQGSNGVMTLTGTQLNGIAQGAQWGDDNESFSNYPIIQLTDANGHVSYARTSNWSSTGVATGSTPESVNFTLPAQDGPGVYSLSVIGDGIASVPVVFVLGSSGNDSVTIDTGSAYLLFVGTFPTVTATLDGVTSTYFQFAVAGIDVLTEGGSNTVNIEHTVVSAPVSVNLVGGTGTVNVSPTAENLGNIQGDVNVSSGSSGASVLNIFDVNNPKAVTYSVTSSTVTRTGAAPITYSSPNHVNLYDGSGNNIGNIESTAVASPLTVWGGNGNETFNVSPTAQNLDTLLSSVTINAVAGPSTLNVNDTKNAQANTWTLSTKTVFTEGFAGTYDTIVRSGWSSELDFEAPLSGIDKGTGKLVVNGGNGNDTYNVEGTKPGIAVTLQGGSGNDTYNISPTAKDLDNIQGNVGISGGLGANTLNIFDGSNSNAVTYSVTSSTVTRTGSATISYNSLTENLTLDGGSANDTYNIESTSASTPVHVNGGTGNDTFSVSPTAKNLNTIKGALTISGYGGNNALNLFDQSNAGVSTYALTSSSVTRNGAALISYSSLESITLDGGSANDTYNIESTSASTPVTIEAGTGNDTFNISPAAKNLDNIRGDVAISGGFGTNTLNLFDENNAKAVTYSVTSTTVTRTGSATISYSSVNMALNGSSGNDTYNINGTPDGMKLALNAGKGNDTFHAIASGPYSSISINGGLGNNTLVGPNVASTWNITGTNAGHVGNVTFSDVENLTGGSGVNVFVFSAGKTISGEINGGSGGKNWLDYAAYTTPVAVNLAAGTATGVGGGIANIRNVRGGQGGNTLTGNAQGNILIGGAGTNTIVGGTGRSILIGGKGKDTVTGHSGSDILIAGYTNYDSSSLANDLGLESILAEWQSANSYATRISHIKNGGGLNGSNKLIWGVTVHDNSTSNANTLTGAGGNGGLNWFFANLTHTKTNRTDNEQLN